jgi:hypothetical protein
MTRTFTSDDATWVAGYVTDVVSGLQERLAPHVGRFPDGERLIQRMVRARDAVLQHGWAHMRAIDEVHNEACVAIAILEANDPPATLLRYEPKLAGTNQTIDFVSEYAGEQPCFIDVKTIAPQTRNRWEQYAAAQEKGFMSDRATVTLLKDWLGGELWHNMFAARGRMLEYTLELEAKAATAGLRERSGCIVLMLCSNGFHWNEDELEDFVAFYTSGTHRPDDHFAQMEAADLKTHPLPPNRVVRQFGYMERSSGAILPSRLNWNAVPPRLPFE